MKLNIRGEKIEITTSMKEYAKEKIEKLNKYIENNDSVEGHILFKVNGQKQKVEITIPLKSATLRVEEEAQDFYSAIDNSIDKIERQIVKNKTRLSSKRNKIKDSFILEFESPISENNNNKIVKRKQIELKPMDEEEAILQLELIGHDFFMFKNVDTGKVAVIYKRKHDNYGLMEEE